MFSILADMKHAQRDAIHKLCLTCAHVLFFLKITWFGPSMSSNSFVVLRENNSQFLNLKYVTHIFLSIAPENACVLMQLKLVQGFSVKLQQFKICPFSPKHISIWITSALCHCTILPFVVLFLRNTDLLSLVLVFIYIVCLH